MDNSILKYNINPLVSAIGKTPDQFTKEDIINFITANDIRVVNFRYIAGDGRLKTLNFPVAQDPQLPGQQPPVSRPDPLVWRESRRLQPLLLHPGRLERPLRHSPFLHGLPRPLR